MMHRSTLCMGANLEQSPCPCAALTGAVRPGTAVEQRDAAGGVEAAGCS